MKLYFSGASGHLEAQPVPENSLGGFISSSPIPNGKINGLFGGLSKNIINSRLKEYRLVVLKNETGDTVSAGAKVFYENTSQEPLTNYKMSYTLPIIDDCGDPKFEKIASSTDIPLNADFKVNRKETNALILPAIANKGFVGIWIERSINVSRAQTLNNCQIMFDKFDTEQTYQTTQITTLADVSDSLNGKYFTFSTTQNDYYVWFNTGGGADPEIDGVAIEVLVDTNDDADTVAVKLKDALDEFIVAMGEAITSITGNVVTIVNSEYGQVDDALDVNTGFSFEIDSGSAQSLEEEESFDLIVDYP